MPSSGRLIDWLGQGLAASRPVSPSVPNDGVGLYFANDTNILSLYDSDAASWFDIDMAVLSALSNESIQDMISTFITSGAGMNLYYDDTANKLYLHCTITQYTNFMARNAIGAALVNGTGITIAYDAGAGTITIASTITQYTNAMADARVVAGIAASSIYDLADVDGTGEAVGKALAWDGANYVPTSVATDEGVRDVIGTALVGTTNEVKVTVDDPGDTITLASPNLTLLLSSLIGAP